MVRSNKQFKNMSDSELRQAYQELKVAVAAPVFGNRVSLVGPYTKTKIDLDLVMQIAKKKGIHLW
jgi:hypothetical protein